MSVKQPSEMTDEELFDELRHQVNLSRNIVGHDRKLTRELSEEMHKRGFMQKRPPTDSTLHTKG